MKKVKNIFSDRDEWHEYEYIHCVNGVDMACKLAVACFGKKMKKDLAVIDGIYNSTDGDPLRAMLNVYWKLMLNMKAFIFIHKGKAWTGKGFIKNPFNILVEVDFKETITDLSLCNVLLWHEIVKRMK